MMLDKNGNEYYQMPLETFDRVAASLKYVVLGSTIVLVACMYPVTVIPMILVGFGVLLWDLN